MAPIFDLEPVVNNISVVPYDKLITTVGLGANPTLCIPGKSLVAYTLNVRQLSVPTIEWSYKKISDFHRKHPTARGSNLMFETFPYQAISAVPGDETAYPWRDAKGYLYVQYSKQAMHQEIFCMTSGYLPSG